jgi:outer membrane protein assembly factor BamE (lipoprotein component of BamABCDE complex)
MKRTSLNALFILTLILFSCESKKERVDLKGVANGMSKDEVRKVVGEPDSVSADGNEWYYGKKTNAVVFQDGAVFLVSLDYQQDGSYEAHQKSFDKKIAYEVQPDLTAHETNIKITFDGSEADVIKVSNATLVNDVVTITARSEKGGCEFSIVLNKNGSYNGEMSIKPEKYIGKNAPFSFGALQKAEKLILNTTNFEKGTKLVVQFSYREEVSLEMASSDDRPIVLEGVLVNEL